jgi:hypothetical protein
MFQCICLLCQSEWLVDDVLTVKLKIELRPKICYTKKETLGPILEEFLVLCRNKRDAARAGYCLGAAGASLRAPVIGCTLLRVASCILLASTLSRNA